jgi:hypothetical protein
MRNIGLVSAAVIAMAAMAGAVAASAPPVMQTSHLFSDEAYSEIRASVRAAEEAGLSGEAAQQLIKDRLQGLMRGDIVSTQASQEQMSIMLDQARRSLINQNELRRGSDGDLAVSALLAERDPRSSANRPGNNWHDGTGGGTRGRGGETLQPRQAPAAGQGSPTAGGAGRNLPGNEAAGQAATNAGTTEIQQTQTTNDPDLDDEAGEPD